MSKKNKIEKKEEGIQDEQFIPTFFTWVQVDKQKEKAEEMEKMTENKHQK